MDQWKGIAISIPTHNVERFARYVVVGIHGTHHANTLMYAD